MASHNVTFHSEDDIQIPLPLDCVPEALKRFVKAFEAVAKKLKPIEKKTLLQHLQKVSPGFTIVVEDAICLKTTIGGKPYVAIALVEPENKSMRFAGRAVMELSPQELEELIAHELGHAMLNAEADGACLPTEAFAEIKAGMTDEEVRAWHEKWADVRAADWGYPQHDLTNWMKAYAERHKLLEVPMRAV